MERNILEEDIWASEDDDDITSKDSMTIKEWGKIENCMEKDGFRQGLEADQEQALQDGFNTAFKQSFELALAAGMFQGEICAKLQDTIQVPSHRESTGKASSERDAEEASALEEISDRVSALIANIPKELIHKCQGIEQHCGNSSVCHSRVSEYDTQKNSGEDCCNNSSEVKFWDKLTELKLRFSSLVHS